MKNVGLVIGIVLIVVLVLALFGGTGVMGLSGFGMMGLGMMGGYGYGNRMGSYGGFGFNPISAILSFVFWVLIFGGIALLVIGLIYNVSVPSSSPRPDSAIAIVKARYARGAITNDQFETMKRDLE